MGPNHQGLRPTTDLVREALFSILQNFPSPSVSGGRVLDLFAGSGALGIEALSRGAYYVTFVEQDPRSLRLLKQNLQRLREEHLAVRVIPGDAFRTLPRLSREDENFDLILIDPPYHANLWNRVVMDVDELQLLKEEGVIVLELPKRLELPENIGGLTRKDKRIYGEVSLEFWGHKTSGVERNDDCHLSG